MEKWFEFTAYNSQTLYGFGTDAEASKYCDIINRHREVNVYGYRELSEGEAAGLESGDDTDGFRLDLELDNRAEQDEWRAEEESRRHG